MFHKNPTFDKPDKNSYTIGCGGWGMHRKSYPRVTYNHKVSPWKLKNSRHFYYIIKKRLCQP